MAAAAVDGLHQFRLSDRPEKGRALRLLNILGVRDYLYEIPTVSLEAPHGLQHIYEGVEVGRIQRYTCRRIHLGQVERYQAEVVIAVGVPELGRRIRIFPRWYVFQIVDEVDEPLPVGSVHDAPDRIWYSCSDGRARMYRPRPPP